MPNTTNFNWPTPADTDLVKDGAAAIRNLGDGVDTSLVDLKGGTTGQILSKASNADMDFTFITPNVGDLTEVQAGTGISVADGTGPIPIVTNTVATEFDAKGDLVVGTGSDTFDRLPVGTDGYTLVADSSTATGLAYAAPAGKILNVFNAYTGNTFSTSSTTFTNITTMTHTITPQSSSSKFLLIFNSFQNASGGATVEINYIFARGGTGVGDAIALNQAGGPPVGVTLIYQDSPATASSITYTTQIKTNTGTINAYTKSFIIMEIGA